MPDLLLELFSEEIPARMQAQAARDLERLVVAQLSDRALLFEGVKALAGPRRLTLAVSGLPVKQPDATDEKKGPRTNAPAKAIDGFLRSAGVALDACEKRDDGKGEFYVAVIFRQGRSTIDVLSEVLPAAIAKLPWPKSMRWGTGGQVRWVRPLHRIVATFDGECVPFEFAGVTSGTVTEGHRFLSSGPIEIRRFDDYEKKLRDAHVLIDASERMDIVRHDVRQKAFALGLELVEDEGLLEEVAGLAEWPVVLIGRIEDQFMSVPAEVLQTSMRTHQKYFSLRDPKTGKLASRFAFVANMLAEDGGKEIISGNERVLRARLSDAKFFYDLDIKTPLIDRVPALAEIVFQAKLGTQLERVKRVEALAGEMAAKVGADAARAKRAAHLCKADLTSGVVGEFPELQGIMGRYLALNDREDADIADAIRDHYRPLGPGDAVPDKPVTIAVALADKLDILTGFFSIGEKPTGSGDPFALRRAALGMIRIVLSNKLKVALRPLIAFALRGRGAGFDADELLGFFADRLKVALREQGTRHDLIDAVFSLGHEDDLVRLVSRVEALQGFLRSDDGANLLVAYRRAANILKVEEKKDNTVFEGAPDPEAFAAPEEKALFVELATAGELIRAEIDRERFVEAMGVMSRLRKPIDLFFEKVTVNAPEAALRRNRLQLLSRLRATMHLVADFSRVEG
jgi:glycyl-tRNA synthetase beta chain